MKNFGENLENKDAEIGSKRTVYMTCDRTFDNLEDAKAAVEAYWDHLSPYDKKFAEKTGTYNWESLYYYVAIIKGEEVFNGEDWEKNFETEEILETLDDILVQHSAEGYEDLKEDQEVFRVSEPDMEDLDYDEGIEI